MYVGCDATENRKTFPRVFFFFFFFCFSRLKGRGSSFFRDKQETFFSKGD